MGTVLPAELISLLAGALGSLSLVNGHRFLKAMSVILALLLTICILLLKSRAALFSFVCGFLYLLLCFRFKHNHKWYFVLFLLAIAVIGTILYFIRPASAMGRLYIWRVCLDMIKERPLGFGWNGFIHQYMYYQADYLSTHPNTIFNVLADNVAFPYNEFLHTTISFGIPGLVLLLFVIWDTLSPHTYSSKDLIVKSLLVNYLVFSSFSYPTDAIYTCLLFPILTLLSRKGFLGPYVNILCGAIIVVATLLFIKRDTLERKIRNECFLYQEQRVDKLLHDEKEGLSLFPELRELILARIPTDHLTRYSDYILESARQCPNSESICRAGDVMAMQGDVRAALSYYDEASRMVPSRLTPRYKAFCLLLKNEQIEEAKAKGKEILSMDLKIRSSEVIQIRNKVKKAMMEFNLMD